MPTSAKAIVGGGGIPGKLLHGSDLPANKDKVVIHVTAVRLPPSGFRSKLILDIVPVLNGKVSWAVNLSNIQTLAEQVGDDLDVLVGRKIELTKVSMNNPQTGQMVPSLVVTRVSKTVTPIPAEHKAPEPPAATEAAPDDDIPF